MVVLLAILLPARALKAQGSIQISRYLGGNGEESGVGSVTTAGNTYLWCATTSTDMPVTNGSSFKGGVDLYVANSIIMSK